MIKKEEVKKRCKGCGGLADDFHYGFCPVYWSNRRQKKLKILLQNKVDINKRIQIISKITPFL